MKVLVTGSAGFIGSALIRRLLADTEYRVVNIDALTYAGHLATVADVSPNPRYQFAELNITDASGVNHLFTQHRPIALVHLAAESHVDRSIDGPEAFINSNVIGTYTLLEAARRYVSDSDNNLKDSFRFHHVSTDEVFGSLGPEGRFTEESPYQPNSPYSASI